jgi:hypothetical protein
MQKGNAVTVLVGLVWLSASGCATVVNGTTQKVGVSSNPPGAHVLIDNQIQVYTPASVDLSRSQSHTFYFRKEGYQDDSFVLTSGTSGWVFGNIIAGGLIGGMVDFATGAARKLSQDQIHVTLAPLAAGQQPASFQAFASQPTSTHLPPPAPAMVVPVAQSLPAAAPSTPGPLPQWTSDNPTSTVDTQMRNLDREFRAGKISLDEYRKIKKVLQGDGQ